MRKPLKREEMTKEYYFYTAKKYESTSTHVKSGLCEGHPYNKFITEDGAWFLMFIQKITKKQCDFLMKEWEE